MQCHGQVVDLYTAVSGGLACQGCGGPFEAVELHEEKVPELRGVVSACRYGHYFDSGKGLVVVSGARGAGGSTTRITFGDQIPMRHLYVPSPPLPLVIMCFP